MLVPEHYRVDTAVFREMEMDSVAYERWLEVVMREGAAVYQGVAGLRLALDKDLERVVLHPGDGVVGERERHLYHHSADPRQVSLLLMGDIEAEVEQESVRNNAPLAARC